MFTVFAGAVHCQKKASTAQRLRESLCGGSYPASIQQFLHADSHAVDGFGERCDFILRSLSEQVKSILRNTDFVARYGGEEFCCILPETGIKQALVIAERCRAAVAETTFEYQDAKTKITISLGVAEMTPEIASPAVLIEKADQALYEAKHSGRNRVIAAGQRDL